MDPTIKKHQSLYVETKLNGKQEAAKIYLQNKCDTKGLTLLLVKELLQISKKKTNIRTDKQAKDHAR